LAITPGGEGFGGIHAGLAGGDLVPVEHVDGGRHVEAGGSAAAGDDHRVEGERRASAQTAWPAASGEGRGEGCGLEAGGMAGVSDVCFLSVAATDAWAELSEEASPPHHENRDLRGAGRWLC
jgi:hypothetical protein